MLSRPPPCWEVTARVTRLGVSKGGCGLRAGWTPDPHAPTAMLLLLLLDSSAALCLPKKSPEGEAFEGAAY